MSEKFEGLVAEVAGVELELRSLSGDVRVSAQSIIRDCLQLGDSNPERLTEMKRLLDSRSDFLGACRAFIHQVEMLFQAGRINSGAPQSYARMASAISRDSARDELASSAPNHNLFELWSIACENAAKRHPEVFGKIDDAAAHQAKLGELKTRRELLFGQIPQAWDTSDVVIRSVDADGRVEVGLKLAPLQDLPERLIHHLLQIDPGRWASEPSKVGPPKLSKARMLKAGNAA